MVILTSKKILELRNLYTKQRAFKYLNVLKELELIALQNASNSIPFSFNIPNTHCDCDTIVQVLHDIGIPYIYIRSTFKTAKGFHIQLYEFCK